MPDALRHHRPLALVALATLVGLLLAPSAASAGCESMASGGSCSAAMVACCCSPAIGDAGPDSDRARPGGAVLPPPAACPTAGSCRCSDRPEVPAEPSPKPARAVDDGRADRVDRLACCLPEPRPFPSPLRAALSPDGRPPHVPIYLRDSRLLT